MFTSAVTSTPLDDFLNDTRTSTAGERLQQFGLVGSLSGILVAAGVVAFLRWVHVGSHREIALLVRIVTAAGAVTLIGAAVELWGVASIGDIGWLDALSDSTGRAPTFRLAAGLLILFGIAPTITDDDDGAVAWRPNMSSLPVAVGVAAGVLSFGFDGHTRTEGVRPIHMLTNVAHVAAGGVWVGGVIALACVAHHRRRTEATIGSIAVRFANVAAIALVVVGLAGALMTLMIIDGLSDVYRTEWGRALLVKVGAVGIVAAIGGYNHFRLVPALDANSDDAAATMHLRHAVTIEAVILVLVGLLTVWLSTASTN